MVIEVTQEMINILNASDRPTGAASGIVKIIERDYLIQRRCSEELMPGVRCHFPLIPGERTHFGEHEAMLPTGNGVSWGNMS